MLDDFGKGLETAVVHVRCGEADLAQSWRLEPALVGRLAGHAPPTGVRLLLGDADVVEIVIRQIGPLVTEETARLVVKQAHPSLRCGRERSFIALEIAIERSVVGD